MCDHFLPDSYLIIFLDCLSIAVMWNRQSARSAALVLSSVSYRYLSRMNTALVQAANRKKSLQLTRLQQLSRSVNPQASVLTATYSNNREYFQPGSLGWVTFIIGERAMLMLCIRNIELFLGCRITHWVQSAISCASSFAWQRRYRPFSIEYA